MALVRGSEHPVPDGVPGRLGRGRGRLADDRLEGTTTPRTVGPRPGLCPGYAQEGNDRCTGTAPHGEPAVLIGRLIAQTARSEPPQLLGLGALLRRQVYTF